LGISLKKILPDCVYAHIYIYYAKGLKHFTYNYGNNNQQVKIFEKKPARLYKFSKSQICSLSILGCGFNRVFSRNCVEQ